MYKYIAPITILGIFLIHSYKVQSELQQKEVQEYISIKELSELSEKKWGYERPLLDKAMITFFDWIIPGSFINKKESLKVFDALRDKAKTSNTEENNLLMHSINQEQSLNEKNH